MMTWHRSLLRAVYPLCLAVVPLLACQESPPDVELGTNTSALSWRVSSRIDPPAGREQMGGAMAASGNWLAVSSQITGAAAEGVVSLYERVSGSFVLRQELRASSLGFPEDNAQFGNALALDGDTLAIGVPRANALTGDRTRYGVVLVFVRSASGTFAQVGEPLRPPPVAPDDDLLENRYINFGASLSLSGNLLAVGASAYRSRSGRAYVYERSSAGASFAQLADIPSPLPDYWDPAWGSKPTYTNDTRFGTVVSLLGDRLLVAQAETDGHTQAGRVHTYVRSGSAFVHRSELLAPTHATHPETDRFGAGFAQYGDTLVVCSGQSGSKQLFAYEFDATSATWTGPSYSDDLTMFTACQPALSATRLAVGQSRWSSGVDQVRVYPRVGSSDFGPVELATPDTVSGSVAFGGQVYVDDTHLIASAPAYNSVGAVFDLGPRFEIHIPWVLPIWRWKWDNNCLSCPFVSFVWPEQDEILVQDGPVQSLLASRLGNAALHGPHVQWFAVDNLNERARRLPDFVGLSTDGTRFVGALGFADGQLRTAQELDFKVHSDDGKVRPVARFGFAAVYAADRGSPSVLMLGGKDEQGALRRELWRFDLKRGEWSSVASELPEALAQPLGVTYDSGRQLMYVAARGEQGNRVYAVEIDGCKKAKVREVEVSSWVSDADDVELALTPEGRLVIAASQLEKQSWAIAVSGCKGKLGEPVRGTGVVAGGLRATDEGVAFIMVTDEPKASFLPYSALSPN